MMVNFKQQWKRFFFIYFYICILYFLIVVRECQGGKFVVKVKEEDGDLFFLYCVFVFFLYCEWNILYCEWNGLLF